jgi:5-methylthioribose kinase
VSSENALHISDVRGERRLTLTKRERKNRLPDFWNWEIRDAVKVLRFRVGYAERHACRITGRLLRTLFPTWWSDDEVRVDRIRARYHRSMRRQNIS